MSLYHNHSKIDTVFPSSLQYFGAEPVHVCWFEQKGEVVWEMSGWLYSSCILVRSWVCQLHGLQLSLLAKILGNCFWSSHCLLCFYHISATSPYLHGYILFCQLVSLPTVIRLLVISHSYNRYQNTRWFINIYYSFLGIWNLDFFRLVYEPFCLHPHMTVLQGLSHCIVPSHSCY